MREKRSIKEIKQAIIDYCNSEYSENNKYEDFEKLYPDPAHIGLAYTEIPNGEHSIQYEINILNNTWSQYVDNKLIKSDSFLNQDDMLESIKFGNFDDYVYVEEEDLEKALGLSIDDEGDFYNKNERISVMENKQNKNQEKVEEFNPHIKFWNNRIHEYERKNYFTKEKETMFRIRLPKESKYNEYSLDTSIVPKQNKDGKTSYITIVKDFEYKLIAPGKTEDGKLDWDNSDSLKVSGYELKEEFSKDKSLTKNYDKDILLNNKTKDSKKNNEKTR